ncbi:unnamed protein product, partial [Brachionus calyciflorus]
MNNNLKIINQILRSNEFYRIISNKSISIRFNSSTTQFENRNILQEKDRGLIVGIFPNKNDQFDKLMSSGVQSVYCGFDPTAASLHIGNLIAIIMLIHCQRRGHNPIALIGSATALIGDPSGKIYDRMILDSSEIVTNSNRIQKNILKIFQNHEEFIWNRNHQIPLPKLKILNNIKWYENMNIIKFMSLYGKHLRMGDLLSRKQIETRIKSKEGINYTEFSYQLFQAFDWLHLVENHNCTIQIGGNDQTGNIKTGHELISKLKPEKRIFGLTLPIITSEKGDKLGKSAGNAVWLENDMFSAFDFYQFFYNTSDQMVETYLKLFTFLPNNEIDDLMFKHRKNPEKFLAQRKLASETTILVHGETGLDSAIKCTNAFFHSDRESLAKMTEKEIESAFKGASVVTLTMAPEMSVLECVVKANCFKSIEEAAKIIQAGGFRINGTMITNPQEALIYGQHILPNNITIIRV